MRGPGRGVRTICMRSLVWGLSLCLPLVAEPQDRPIKAAAMHTPQRLELVKGKSLLIETPVTLKRVSLAEPEIADALVISPRQLYLTAKAVGTTNVTLWEENERVFAIYDLVISPDLSQLKEKLSEILPGEDIRVTATHETITLFGRISSTAKLSQALEVANAFAPNKVVNLLQVAGVHQVQLEVRVAEIVAFGHQAVRLQFCGTDRGCSIWRQSNQPIDDF